MLSVNPLSKPFAAEVTGIDLGRDLDDDLFAEIHEAWCAHPVLVFRDQEIDTDAQQAFAERFGVLKSRMRKGTDPGATADENPFVMFVSNIRKNGKLIGTSPKGALNFHSDSAFDEVPAKASLLYGIEHPKSGGNTLFVSMYEVYETLSDDTKRFIADKWGVNYHLPSLPLDPNQTDEERMRTARRSVHPMVIAHPETGQPVLYASRHMTRKIVGMPDEDANALLEELYQRIEEPRFLYSHKWRKGDLVVWDNRCVQHGRSDFDPAERRLLRRFAVGCEARPAPYSELCGDIPEFEAAATH
jgi:taurine dioxygenase